MGTVSVSEGDVDELVDVVPSLVLVLRCDRLLEAPVRIPLADVTRVTLGRGDPAVVRNDAEVTIRVPDDRMSMVHARLARIDERFHLEYIESKNGTHLNGRRVEAALPLADGDVIEAGHTFFVYRPRVPRSSSAEPTCMAITDTGEIPLATLQPNLARQFELVDRVARSTIPVVVLGETGTGKEVVARAIHRLSRRTGPLLALNCGAIPPTLLESELFGARRGAFSGAIEDRPGLVRAADGGTLFLDEIGELPLPAQVALLRVLQEHEVLPIGGTKPIKVDVRIVAATHKALNRMVDAGKFRADLLARIAGLNVRLPPLRERREDLGLIVNRLLHRLTDHPELVRLSLRAARALFVYSFPHNIRELEKALALGLTIARPDAVGAIELDVVGFPEELRREIRQPATRLRPKSMDDERKAHLITLLIQHRGVIADVARAMGKARIQIHRWLDRYGIDIDDYRQP